MKKKVHPNSIANLVEITSPEMAREYQLRSAASRKKNRERREVMKELVKAYKGDVDAVLADMPTGLQIMQMELAQALLDEDKETIRDLAPKIAEYQDAKITRQEVHQTNVNLADLSDEELAEYERLLQENGNDMEQAESSEDWQGEETESLGPDEESK